MPLEYTHHHSWAQLYCTGFGFSGANCMRGDDRSGQCLRTDCTLRRVMRTHLFPFLSRYQHFKLYDYGTTVPLNPANNRVSYRRS